LFNTKRKANSDSNQMLFAYKGRNKVRDEGKDKGRDKGRVRVRDKYSVRVRDKGEPYRLCVGLKIFPL
jgi:hypothetical protein